MFFHDKMHNCFPEIWFPSWVYSLCELQLCTVLLQQVKSNQTWVLVMWVTKVLSRNLDPLLVRVRTGEGICSELPCKLSNAYVKETVLLKCLFLKSRSFVGSFHSLLRSLYNSIKHSKIPSWFLCTKEGLIRKPCFCIDKHSSGHSS